MAIFTPNAFKLPEGGIDYPESDGKPMAETDTHIRAMIDSIVILKDFFRDRPDAYVAGNMLLYYEEGNPAASVAPDVFVVYGVDKHLRRTYRLWEEGQAPAVVIELTSRSTALEDQGNKRTLYAWFGVEEYFLCDPLSEYMRPPLQGFRLLDGEYVRIEPEPDGSLTSQVLGMRLLRIEGRIRFINVETGEPLLWPDEVADARRAAEAEAHAEADARRAAEAEIARLRAEIEQLRGTSPTEASDG
jgi:Uma2 family endonuclease